ncbi:uncharacterized protein C5orf49 homolog isoform X2 [Phoca vitulina]|uniref:uncharacterized protein C5orf49 homolog isoform X2 n=1 Tax=Phoca vitulina TaxID=9720 RepID=UPI00139632F6|nr:uncharacterized protein C5orf49 homolog isoform X2 [Phoca vitulina]
MEDDEEEELSAATLRGKPRPPPLSALSAFSYIPPRRLDPKEHSYYYRQAKVVNCTREVAVCLSNLPDSPSRSGTSGTGQGTREGFVKDGVGATSHPAISIAASRAEPRSRREWAVHFSQQTKPMPCILFTV